MSLTFDMPWRTLIEHVERFAERGFRPIPLANGKPIMRAWPNAEPGVDKAAERFLRRPRADGVGVVTGDGFLAIDVDRHGIDDGFESMARLVRDHGRLPHGPRVYTPRRGLHLWFRAPPCVAVRTATGVVPGVDVRGERGFITAPPSVKQCGVYRWAESLGELPVAPAWLIDLVRVKPPPCSFVPPPGGATKRAFSGAEHPYVRVAFDRAFADLQRCSPGRRNASLFSTGARFFGYAASGHIEDRVVEQALLQASHANGLTADDGLQSVCVTIASARRRGFVQPRDPPPPRNDATRGWQSARCRRHQL